MITYFGSTLSRDIQRKDITLYHKYIFRQIESVRSNKIDENNNNSTEYIRKYSSTNNKLKTNDIYNKLFSSKLENYCTYKRFKQDNTITAHNFPIPLKVITKLNKGSLDLKRRYSTISSEMEVENVVSLDYLTFKKIFHI